jgi:hypothetical protein
LIIPLLKQGERFVEPMSEYTKYLENVYSDEHTPDWIDDVDDVQRMAKEGYHRFSIELEQEIDEQQAWKGSKRFNEILIKKACEHSDCPHTQCVKSLRVGGIEV